MALVDAVTILGSRPTRNVREAITSATLSGSLTEVTQLEMTLIDPDWKLLEAGYFGLNMRVEVNEFKLEISNIETGADGSVETTTLKCRPIVVRRLKDRRGPRVMRNVSPSEFVIAECKAVGAGYVVQPSARRKQVARDVPQKGEQEVAVPPSSWTTFQRLARELGFIVFESCGVIYFGQPTWLMNSGAMPTVEVAYNAPENDPRRPLSVPKCVWTRDEPAKTMSTLMLIQSASQFRPGKRLILSGVPQFNGSYIMSSFSVGLLDPVPTADISAATPVNPKPQPPK